MPLTPTTIPWPVLKTYDAQHLLRIAMPIGGIGTGTVSLGGRGNLQDWEVVNRPAKGFNPKNAFFALYARHAGGEPVTRALEGPLDPAQYEGAQGSDAPNHSLPRFRECQFKAAYPLAQVLLSDPQMPLTVRLEAFNPLVPPDADASGIPLAVLRYVLPNPTGQTIQAAVCGSLQNFIGADGSDPKFDGASRRTYDHQFHQNTNEYRAAPGVRGIFMSSDGLDPCAEAYGTLALATTAAEGVTYRTAWANLPWGDSLLDFWDDFSQDGRLEERSANTAGSAGPSEWAGTGTGSLGLAYASGGVQVGAGRLIGVTEQEAASLSRAFKAIQIEGQPAIRSVEAFGSRAGSTFRGRPPLAGSDLDVFVTLDTGVVNSPARLMQVLRRTQGIAEVFQQGKGFPLQMIHELDTIAPAVKANLKATPFVPLE